MKIYKNILLVMAVVFSTACQSKSKAKKETASAPTNSVEAKSYRKKLKKKGTVMARGWNYCGHGAPTGNGKAYGSMTTAGLTALAICRAVLRSQKKGGRILGPIGNARDAGLATNAGEDALVRRQRSGMARRRGLAGVGDPTAYEDQGLQLGMRLGDVEKTSAVATDALQIDQAHRGGWIDRVVFEVVGQRELCGVTAGDGFGNSDASDAGVVHVARSDVAALADHRDRPLWGVRSDDLGAQFGFGRDHALAVGACHCHSQFIG